MTTLLHTSLKSTSLAVFLLASVFSYNHVSAATSPIEMGATVKPDIKKLIVKGNTKVMLVQSNREYVTIDELDLEKVTLKQVGGTLTISSSESSPVTVVVYVKDLYHIGASDQASVKTSGTFHIKHLQVMLSDDATARIKANTESLYTVINDSAKLELAGTTDNHIAESDGIANLDTQKFAAVKTEYISPSIKALAFNIFNTPATVIQ